MPKALLASPEAIERGRKIYVKHCALCHGERADGRGVRRNLSSRPVDFTDAAWRERTSARQVFFAVREGVRGTAMAGWKTLDAEQAWEVVAYVLSVSEPSS